MDLFSNDKLQEFFLLVGDRMAPLNRKWLYALGGIVVFCIPLFFLFRLGFFYLLFNNYQPPALIYQPAQKEPYSIVEKRIFKLSDNVYSGFFKIRNINLEWGSIEQKFSAEFKTLGGTVITRINGKAYILPASDKIVVFSKFTTDKTPEVLEVSLGETKYLHRNDLSLNLEIQSTNIRRQNNSLIVSSALKNLSPFTITQVDLPVLLFNSKRELIGVNYTNVNQIRSNELRTFQYFWPYSIEGVVFATIEPEVNIFLSNIIFPEDPKSPFDDYRSKNE